MNTTDPRTPLAPQQPEHVKPIENIKDGWVHARWQHATASVMLADMGGCRRGDVVVGISSRLAFELDQVVAHANLVASVAEWIRGTLDELQRQDQENTPARQEAANEPQDKAGGD